MDDHPDLNNTNLYKFKVSTEPIFMNKEFSPLFQINHKFDEKQ